MPPACEYPPKKRAFQYPFSTYLVQGCSKYNTESQADLAVYLTLSGG